jgi:hypothetical protein
MTSREDLIKHIDRLVRLVRSAKMKRVLSTVDPNPKLNFWRVIHGDELDISVLEWCKVFGTNTEPTHWKAIVPGNDQERFRADMLVALGVNDSMWADYWTQMKAYRDNLVAHHIEATDVTHYPVLDLALRSSYFYYDYVIAQLRGLGDKRFPDDLKRYADDFEAQANEVAQRATSATADMKEQVF